MSITLSGGSSRRTQRVSSGVAKAFESYQRSREESKQRAKNKRASNYAKDIQKQDPLTQETNKRFEALGESSKAVQEQERQEASVQTPQSLAGPSQEQLQAQIIQEQTTKAPKKVLFRPVTTMEKAFLGTRAVTPEYREQLRTYEYKQYRAVKTYEDYKRDEETLTPIQTFGRNLYKEQIGKIKRRDPIKETVSIERATQRLGDTKILAGAVIEGVGTFVDPIIKVVGSKQRAIFEKRAGTETGLRNNELQQAQIEAGLVASMLIEGGRSTFKPGQGTPFIATPLNKLKILKLPPEDTGISFSRPGSKARTVIARDINGQKISVGGVFDKATAPKVPVIDEPLLRMGTEAIHAQKIGATKDFIELPGMGSTERIVFNQPRQILQTLLDRPAQVQKVPVTESGTLLKNPSLQNIKTLQSQDPINWVAPNKPVFSHGFLESVKSAQKETIRLEAAKDPRQTKPFTTGVTDASFKPYSPVKRSVFTFQEGSKIPIPKEASATQIKSGEFQISRGYQYDLLDFTTPTAKPISDPGRLISFRPSPQSMVGLEETSSISMWGRKGSMLSGTKSVFSSESTGPKNIISESFRLGEPSRVEPTQVSTRLGAKPLSFIQTISVPEPRSVPSISEGKSFQDTFMSMAKPELKIEPISRESTSNKIETISSRDRETISFLQIKPKIRDKQRQSQEVVQEAIPEQLQEQIIIPNIPIMPRIRLPSLKSQPRQSPSQETPPSLLPPTGFRSPYVKMGLPGFDVFVRRRGLFNKVNIDPLPRLQAFNKGLVTVGTTAAASFKILPSQSMASSSFSGRGVISDFTQKNGVFIEKPSRRIKSRGELEEITFKGLKTIRLGKNLLLGGKK